MRNNMDNIYIIYIGANPKDTKDINTELDKWAKYGKIHVKTKYNIFAISLLLMHNKLLH